MKSKSQQGKIGYIILWFLGVPASLLILMRFCELVEFAETLVEECKEINLLD